jgi:fibronectin-binding autotransporter adhesin
VGGSGVISTPGPRSTLPPSVLGLLTLAVMAAGIVVAVPAWAGPNVNCSAGADLQGTLSLAPPGSNILIQGTCRGNFVIAGKSLTLTGNPTATLDGMESGHTLEVTTNNVLHLVHLTVTGGGSVESGAGVDAVGSVTLNHVTVTRNEATSSTTAAGGGVASKQNITVTSSTITSNRADAAGNNSSAIGGGLVASHDITITDSTIAGNVATSQSAAGGPSAAGGGIGQGGLLTVTNSKITGNRIGISGDGGFASGSAVFTSGASGAVILKGSVVSGNEAGAVSTTTSDTTAGPTVYSRTSFVTISGSTVSNNVATARAASAPAEAFVVPGVAADTTLTAKNSVFRGNTGTARGSKAEIGGAGLFAVDGTVGVAHLNHVTVSGNSGKAIASAGEAEAFAAVYATHDVTMLRSTVNRNALIAVAEGGDATAVAGLLVEHALTTTASTVSRNAASAQTTSAGSTAGAVGGLTALRATVRNSTIALNVATGSSANPGGTTLAQGAGIYLPSATMASSLVDDTIAGNRASGTGATVTAQGGGLWANPVATLQSTIVAQNLAATGADCFGGPTSKGYNLIGKTGGCSYTKKGTDHVNVNPQLGTLGTHGGPTETIGIKAASPAHDAVPPLVCPFHADQRGVHRPEGPKCDIGAFELKPGEIVAAPLGSPPLGSTGPRTEAAPAGTGVSDALFDQISSARRPLGSCCGRLRI